MTIALQRQCVLTRQRTLININRSALPLLPRPDSEAANPHSGADVLSPFVGSEKRGSDGVTTSNKKPTVLFRVQLEFTRVHLEIIFYLMIFSAGMAIGNSLAHGGVL
jgi:hypothetical protein